MNWLKGNERPIVPYGAQEEEEEEEEMKMRQHRQEVSPYYEKRKETKKYEGKFVIGLPSQHLHSRYSRNSKDVVGEYLEMNHHNNEEDVVVEEEEDSVPSMITEEEGTGKSQTPSLTLISSSLPSSSSTSSSTSSSSSSSSPLSLRCNNKRTSELMSETKTKWFLGNNNSSSSVVPVVDPMVFKKKQAFRLIHDRNNENNNNDDNDYDDDYDNHDDDYNCTRDELLEKIENLSLRLQQTKDNVCQERNIRIKNEQHIQRLTEEYKKKLCDINYKRDQIYELKERSQVLKTMIQKEQIEFDSHVTRTEQLHRDHKRDMLQAQHQYRTSYREHQSRIAALKKAHEIEKRDILRQMRSVKREVDHLRRRLNDDNDNDNTNHKYYSNSQSMGRDSAIWKRNMKRTIQSLFMPLFIMGLVIAVSPEWFSMDGMCAPAMPGSHVTPQQVGSVKEAPWWAPRVMKQPIFHTVCGPTRNRVRLSWKSNTVVAFDKVHDNGDTSLLFKRKANAVEIRSDRILFFGKYSHIQQTRSLWQSH